MVASCSAFGCTARWCKGSGNRFFRFPADHERKEKWSRAIKRLNWQPSTTAVICGFHFQTGKPNKDPNHPDYIPNVFCFNQNKKATAKLYTARSSRREGRMTEKDRTTEEELAATTLLQLSNSLPLENKLELEIEHLKEELQKSYDIISNLKNENDALKKQISENKKSDKDIQTHKKESEMFKNISSENEKLKKKLFEISFSESVFQSSEKLKFYTSIENAALFDFLLELVIEQDIPPITTCSQKVQLLCVLIKLKLNLFNTDLAYRLNISRRTVSRIFDFWIPLLGGIAKNFIIWPAREVIRRNLPSCFKNSTYRDTVAIIDCTEIFLQRPGNQNARAQTFSNYKHHHTIKFLIGITPIGTVSFLSKSWGGRASDKEITLTSGILDLLKPGDVVIADRGFIVEDYFVNKGAKLVVPAFKRGRKQLLMHDILRSKIISNVRIHVERVIGQIKKFEILNSMIPITSLKHIESVAHICCALINLSNSVVK